MSRKRGNGEGSIHRRKNGGWCAQYTVYTAKGRKRNTLYGKTQQEVAGKLAKALSEREASLTIDAGKLRLGGYLGRWLEDNVKHNVVHRTYHNYLLQVRRHIVPALGNVELKTLTHAHVQSLYREKLDAGLSPSTVSYMHAVFNRALKQAVKWSLVPRNVLEAVQPPKVVKEASRTLSPEQAHALLDAAYEDRFQALYVLALTCGLRCGELLGLRWSDVDLESGTLKVNRQLQRMRDGSGLAFLPTKNARGRNIKLANLASRALESHRARQLEEKRRLGGLYRDQGFVFASRTGTPLNPSNVVNRSFKPLLKRAGLPPVRWHDLRHTCATLLLGRGVHPKLVQHLLGHASITMTLDRYSHWIPSMGRHAADGMDEALG